MSIKTTANKNNEFNSRPRISQSSTPRRIYVAHIVETIQTNCQQPAQKDIAILHNIRGNNNQNTRTWQEITLLKVAYLPTQQIKGKTWMAVKRTKNFRLEYSFEYDVCVCVLAI